MTEGRALPAIGPGWATADAPLLSTRPVSDDPISSFMTMVVVLPLCVAYAEGTFAMFTHTFRFNAVRRSALAAAVVVAVVGGVGIEGAEGTAPSTAAGRGSTAGVVSNFADPTMSQPDAITAGPDGALWFTNWNYSSVERITTDGTVTNFPDPNAAGPWGIVVGSDGAMWFTNLVNNVIARITTKGVESYYAPGVVTGPFGITAGPDGALWFADGGSNEIGRITTAGVATEFPGLGAVNPKINEPFGITAGPDGALWFTNYGDNTIGRMTTAGVVTDFSGPGISDPGTIATGPDGALWFTNLGNNSIGRITTNGVVKNFTDPTISGPDDIASGPDGALWFTNGGNDSIGRITTAGVVTQYTGNGISAPDGITAGPDGAMWFTNYGNNSIGRITTGPSLGAQTITFSSTPPTTAFVGGPGYEAVATGGGSGNPVTLTIDPSSASVCSIAGSLVDFIGAGRCVIDANQAGNASYRAAHQVQQRFIVRPPPPTITSPDNVTATVGSSFSFRVEASGTPRPSIGERGKLPKAVGFSRETKGTAIIAGSPRAAGTYRLTITATSGSGKARSVVTQAFTLTVEPE